MGNIMSASYSVDCLDHLSADEFADAYVRPRRPVIVKGLLKECAAVSSWTLEYLRQRAGHRKVLLKEWGASGVQITHKLLGDYIDSLEHYETRRMAGDAAATQRPPYLHDIPLTGILTEAGSDLEQFPEEFFPAWYRTEWMNFAQLFLGPSSSMTPLHFDCL